MTTTANSAELQRLLKNNGFSDPNVRVLTYDGRTQHPKFDRFSIVRHIDVDSNTTLIDRGSVRPQDVQDDDVIFLGRATEHAGPLMGKHFVAASALRAVLADTPKARTWRMIELVDPHTWAERKYG